MGTLRRRRARGMLLYQCQQAVQDRRPEGWGWLGVSCGPCSPVLLLQCEQTPCCPGVEGDPANKNVSVLLTDPSLTPDTEGNQGSWVGPWKLSMTWLCLAPVLSTARPPRPRDSCPNQLPALISLIPSSSQIFPFFPLTPSPSSNQPRGHND